MTTSACFTSRHSWRSRCHASSSRPGPLLRRKRQRQESLVLLEQPVGRAQHDAAGRRGRASGADSPSTVGFRPPASTSWAARRSVHAAIVFVKALFDDVLVQLVGADHVPDLVAARRLLAAGREEPGRLQRSISPPPSSRKSVVAAASARRCRPTRRCRRPRGSPAARSAPRSRRPPGPTTNAGVTSSPVAADSQPNHAPARPASSACRRAAGSGASRYSSSRRATCGQRRRRRRACRKTSVSQNTWPL